MSAVWQLPAYRLIGGPRGGEIAVKVSVGGCELDGQRMPILCLTNEKGVELEIRFPGQAALEIADALTAAFEAANRRRA